MIYCITSKNCFPRDFMGKHFVPNLCYCKKVTHYYDKRIYQSYLQAQAAQISNDLGNKSAIPELVLTWKRGGNNQSHSRLQLTLKTNKLKSQELKDPCWHTQTELQVKYRPSFSVSEMIRSMFVFFFMGKDSFNTEHMI